MGQDYKELIVSQDRIAEIVTVEEEAFFRTLKRGGNILNQIIESSKEHNKEISGSDAFKLKDTYGLPLDEVQLIAKDYGLGVDIKGFEALEIQAKEKSKSAKKATHQVAEESLYKDFVEKHGQSHFVRDQQEVESVVIGILADGQFVDSIASQKEADIIVEKTPFYPEMGGQIGDAGQLCNQKASFEVSNCSSPYKGVIVHTGKVTEGTIQVGDKISASIDHARRRKIANNHTATHLLHWALHEVLGEHARQAGSVVDPERLRFDFAHHKPVSSDELREIESLVNEKIRENLPVQAYEMPYEAAQKRQDIKQFFGEKYGATVRVIDIDFSKELCGGTHTSATGNIGYFRIAKEGSIAAGIRRIEAVTGQQAEALAYAADDLLQDIASTFGVQVSKLKERIQKLQEEMKDTQNELKSMKKSSYEQLAQTLLPPTRSKKGTLVCIAATKLKADELKALGEELSIQAPSCVIALGAESEDKAHIYIKVSADLISQGIQANNLLKTILPRIEGNGGGKADFAQGAGKAKEKLHAALQEVLDIV
jgi:alanyl-tRNA synthetase